MENPACQPLAQAVDIQTLDDLPPDDEERLAYFRPGFSLYLIVGDIPLEKGTYSMANRTRTVLETFPPVPSPVNPEDTFTIRKLSTRHRIERQNAFARMRFVEDEHGNTVTEREVPLGTLNLDDIMMGLAEWTITDNDKAVRITRDNVQDYLDPREIDFLLEEVRRLNPVVFGRTVDEGE